MKSSLGAYGRKSMPAGHSVVRGRLLVHQALCLHL